MERILVEDLDLLYNKNIQDFCKKGYRGHKEGCPNYGKLDNCPPKAPLIDKIINPKLKCKFLGVKFDLHSHREKLRKKHSDWSVWKLNCVLYWQNGVNKELHKVAEEYLIKNKKFVAIKKPEAYGVNITRMLCNKGLLLNWQWPLNEIIKGVLIAEPLDNLNSGKII
jgi:predicted metal-binding protein